MRCCLLSFFLSFSLSAAAAGCRWTEEHLHRLHRDWRWKSHRHPPTSDGLIDGSQQARATTATTTPRASSAGRRNCQSLSAVRRVGCAEAVTRQLVFRPTPLLRAQHILPPVTITIISYQTEEWCDWQYESVAVKNVSCCVVRVPQHRWGSKRKGWRVREPYPNHAPTECTNLDGWTSRLRKMRQTPG